MTMKPFEFIRNILQEDEPFPRSVVEKHYPIFYVNKVLSSHIQNIFIVNEINKYIFSSKWLQYMYYFYGCDKMYHIPFSRIKKDDKKEINKQHMEKMRILYPHLTDEQIADVYPFVDKGLLRQNLYGGKKGND